MYSISRIISKSLAKARVRIRLMLLSSYLCRFALQNRIAGRWIARKICTAIRFLRRNRRNCKMESSVVLSPFFFFFPFTLPWGMENTGRAKYWLAYQTLINRGENIGRRRSAPVDKIRGDSRAVPAGERRRTWIDGNAFAWRGTSQGGRTSNA